MTRLILLTGDTPDDPIQWVRIEGDRPVDGGRAASLAALADSEQTGEGVTVILPGERFAVRRLSAPARNRRQLMQAARFLLEDELAGPVDTLHIALADPGEGDTTRPVIAVERDWLAGWITALREAEIDPHLITADILALGVAGQSVLLVEEDSLTLNLDGEGFKADRPLADDLALALIDASGIDRLGIVRVATAAPLAMPAGLEAQEVGLQADSHVPYFLAGHIADNQPPSLLQGEFEPGIDWRASIRPWRYAAGLAAAFLVVAMISVGIEGMRYHRAADRLEQETQARFAAAYPDLPQRNIAAQARRLAAGGGGGEAAFLPLSSLLATAMEARDGVELAAVTYDPASGLVADIRFTDTEELDRLKSSLQGYGLLVEEGRNLSRDGDSAYIGKLYLRTS